MIVSSNVVTAQPQHNGTTLVHEQHTDINGLRYDYTWFAAADVDIDAVVQQRGQLISADLTRQAEALTLASNYEIPLTPIEIMRRLTPTEWLAFQTSTIPEIIYFRDVFAKTTVIYRSDALTQAGVGALVAANILTAERAVEVMS